MSELRGPVYEPRPREPEEVGVGDALTTLFADAAEGRIEDAKLAERVDAWLPANLRERSVDGR